jgi:protoporphyrin/coproporphyrin ferrochelatase
MTDTVGLLMMAYGTASGPEDIERYYTDIRGGHAPTPEHLQELRDRYAAIGNRFPLLDITTAQAEALAARLNADQDGPRIRSYLGMKHSPPFIPEGVARMREDGIERAVGLVMAPHWSGMSVETYVDRVEQAVAEDGGPVCTFVRQWFDHPSFVGFIGGRVASAIASLPRAARGDATVVFTAHSLPTRELPDGSLRCKRCDLCPDGCRYVGALRATADLVADRLSLPASAIAWQSAGRTADPWWGPPLEDVIQELGKRGTPAIVVCSVGFVSDHLEILYDLDVEARQIAEDAGVTLVRTEMPNADPAFIDVLAEVVRDHLAETATRR